MLTSSYVAKLYFLLDDAGVKIWIDGGWGVDALLEKQTRPHEDVDIVVQQKDLSKLKEFLSKKRYKSIKRPDTRLWNFVLGDDKGHLIDIHVIVFDENGNGIYGPKENGKMYPKESLAGWGLIKGQKVRCISAYWLIKFHTGYELDEADYKDVFALCKKFEIVLPKEYIRFRK